MKTSMVCNIPLIGIFLIGIIMMQPLEGPERTGMVSMYRTAVNRDPGLHEFHALPYPLLLSCDIVRDNCGSITQSDISVFIADGAYNSIDETIFFVDVPAMSDGIFQVDPATCSVVSGTYYSINYGLSMRAIAFDEERYQIWVGEWGDSYLNQYEASPPYLQISSNYTGLANTGAAVDQENDYLFIGTNSYPDMVHVFDISGGELGNQLGAWPVPWQSPSDGYDMAGMAFDDDSGQLVLINQYAGGPGIAREDFDFDMSSGPTAAGYCLLSETAFAWGLALIEDGEPTPGTYSTYNPDIASFSPPFDIDEYGLP